MGVEITWIGHASFRLKGSRCVYIDPWKLDESPADGDVVFVSHSHHDHFSAPDVRKVLAESGVVVAPADVAGKLPPARVLQPGQTIQAGAVTITGVAAYNVGKPFHPKANRWLGAVFELDGVCIYYAGDTDRIQEMSALPGRASSDERGDRKARIDVALLPVGGTYTMNADEAAAAAADIAPAAAIPYHFGDIVGSPADAERFASGAGCTVHVLEPGGSVTIQGASAGGEATKPQ